MVEMKLDFTDALKKRFTRGLKFLVFFFLRSAKILSEDNSFTYPTYVGWVCCLGHTQIRCTAQANYLVGLKHLGPDLVSANESNKTIL